MLIENYARKNIVFRRVLIWGFTKNTFSYLQILYVVKAALIFLCLPTFLTDVVVELQ